MNSKVRNMLITIVLNRHIYQDLLIHKVGSVMNFQTVTDALRSVHFLAQD